jgi:hypothetical protein
VGRRGAVLGALPFRQRGKAVGRCCGGGADVGSRWQTRGGVNSPF